jgi:uncharacterized protein (TIGR03067 family)
LELATEIDPSGTDWQIALASSNIRARDRLVVALQANAGPHILGSETDRQLPGENNMKSQAVVILSLVFLLGADSADQAVEKDLERFQGVWTVESMELNGKPLSEERRKKIRLTIKGENFTFETGADSHAGLYKIDPSQDPKELNIVITRGDEKGKVYLVIYKFEDGKMIQCMRQDNKSRPKSFTGAAGSGCDYEVWQRQKS